MNKDANNYYKTCDFLFADTKEAMKNAIPSEYGYNLDSTKRKIINQNDYFIKSKAFVNKEFLKRLK